MQTKRHLRMLVGSGTKPIQIAFAGKALVTVVALGRNLGGTNFRRISTKAVRSSTDKQAHLTWKLRARCAFSPNAKSGSVPSQ
jgi:hypothetical protein